MTARRRRARKVCSTAGCPELADSGRCTTCRAGAELARGSATERGYDARWRRTRNDFLRHHPVCVEEHCLRWATVVDHVDGLGPLAPLGHDWSNLRPFCKTHHDQRTARDQPGGWSRR